MRRFFRFSVRDLLWLTLVVALGLAWGLREWQLWQQTYYWRGAAGGMQHALELVGWKASLDLAEFEIKMSWDGAASRKPPLFGGETVVIVPFSDPRKPK